MQLRQFLSLFSMFFDICYSSCMCAAHTTLLSEGTADALGLLVPLWDLLLKATEREASSENYRIPPGYYLLSPGTARESHAETIKIKES